MVAVPQPAPPLLLQTYRKVLHSHKWVLVAAPTVSLSLSPAAEGAGENEREVGDKVSSMAKQGTAANSGMMQG